MRPRPFLATLAVLALAGSVPVAAADSRGELPGQIAMEEMAARLGLTADQQVRIAPALQTRNEGLKALTGRLDADAPPREKLKLAREGRSIQQDFVAAVTPVLTEEQNDEWKKMREETRGQLAERRQRRQP